ncbi:MAG: A/G-specific adenine glycosylase [Bacteroidales bacterium]|jgi:A/G-specific adenine glycosylase|nr:A/G-specific adenine glycosylase [Bacteroidales bacterium]
MIGIKIIGWYEQNKRTLPWRDIVNPYNIWVSEIILQQTRVNQGLSYYHKFIEHFPDIFSLAKANMDDVLKIWQGLGYYSRARNMHAAAVFLADQCGGKFPETYSGLLKVKGIGDYTASAIASFAFGEAVPVIDGNVNRVMARLYGVVQPVDALEGKRQIRRHAEKTMIAGTPGLYNQAVMEFGALQCVPHKPDCEACFLKTLCVAYNNGMVSLLPVKSKTSNIKTRYFHYLVVNEHDATYLQRRSDGDIWNGLYEFPMIETGAATEMTDLSASGQWQAWFGRQSARIASASEEVIHRLTHRILKIRFYEIWVDQPPAFKQGQIRVKWDDVHLYAVPKVMDNYLNGRCKPVLSLNSMGKRHQRRDDNRQTGKK